MKYLFLAGLFFLPLISLKGVNLPFELQKVRFFYWWAEALIIIGLILLVLRNRKKVIFDKKLIILVFVFLTQIIISSFFGVDWQKSFWENYWRNDGILTLFHLIGLFVIVSIFWQKSWQDKFSQVISLGSVLISLWVSLTGLRYVLLNQKFITGGPAIGVSFGQPVFLGGFLLITLPFTFYLFKSVDKIRLKFFWALAILVHIIAILLTRSSAAIIGAGIFIICQNLFKKIKPNAKLLFLFFGLSLVIYFSFFFVKGASINEKEFLEGGYRNLFQSRTRIYTKALYAYLQKPILGWGWSNFDYAFDSVIWPIKFNDDVYVDRAHSQILEVLVTTGAFGLIIYLLIIWLALKKLYRKLNNPFYSCLLFTLILYLFHSQTNIISINEELLFWLILGISSQIKPGS